MANLTFLKNGNYLENTTEVVELSTSQFITYMIISIPSWLLYVLVVNLLITSSNNTIFRTAYFKLVILIGLAVRILRNILITMIS